jgi:hypothetical protein
MAAAAADAAGERARREKIEANFFANNANFNVAQSPIYVNKISKNSRQHGPETTTALSTTSIG